MAEKKYRECDGRMLAFAIEYAKTADRLKSALRAGYKQGSAYSISAHLLENPHVQKEIDRNRKAIADAAGISPADVLREIGRVAFFDLGKLFDKDGKPKKTSEIDEDTRRGLIEHNIVLDMNGNTTVKVVCAGKAKALEMLAKHVGLLDQREKTAAPTLNIDINFGESQPPIRVRTIPAEVAALSPPIDMDADGNVMDDEDDGAGTKRSDDPV